MDNQKLSARVEALEGPDRSVDRVIKQAIGHEWDYSADWDYWDALKQEKASQPVAKPYTASLDAAMSLVPQGCGWIAGWGQVLPDEPMGGAHITAHSVFAGYDVANDVIAEGEAATPALALCAAALKARGL